MVCVIPMLLAHTHQYTWSLLIFLVPMLVLTWDLLEHGILSSLIKPMALTLLLLVSMGTILTIGLANEFFIYPTHTATLGITIPAMDLTGFDPTFRIPIEELAFYVLGFSSLIVLYCWTDTVLLPMVRPIYRCPNISLSRFLMSISVGIIFSAIGWMLQYELNPGVTMPGYWIYLMLVPLPVMLTFGPEMASRINWPALALVCLSLWGHAVLLEVTLAIPQRWWGYQYDVMIGLSITSWHNLPIEAVLVWLMTPLVTTISFEAVRAYLTPFPSEIPHHA